MYLVAIRVALSDWAPTAAPILPPPLPSTVDSLVGFSQPVSLTSHCRGACDRQRETWKRKVTQVSRQTFYLATPVYV